MKKRHFWIGFMRGWYLSKLFGATVFIVWMCFADPPLLYWLAGYAAACCASAQLAQMIYRQLTREEPAP